MGPNIGKAFNILSEAHHLNKAINVMSLLKAARLSSNLFCAILSTLDQLLIFPRSSYEGVYDAWRINGEKLFLWLNDRWVSTRHQLYFLMIVRPSNDFCLGCQRYDIKCSNRKNSFSFFIEYCVIPQRRREESPPWSIAKHVLSVFFLDKKWFYGARLAKFNFWWTCSGAVKCSRLKEAYEWWEA